LLAVEAAVEGVVEPVVDGAAQWLGERVGGFERIVDDEHVAAAAG
jgi:hypothetical protein